ncbi:outer membrane protein assembly factor BamA [Thermonema rossianum]|uniref:outer membrane protein assembly factor BamA n=1 Tax=Thermonema rossianum TaxID=55505 RepID=UPI00056F0488|nr:outer membrane protein assembly factor BamA [Thermonema rossianum]
MQRFLKSFRVLVCLLLLTNLANAQNQSGEYVIAGINISGVKFLDSNALLNMAGLKVGDTLEIPGTRTATAIKKLWDTGLFGDIEITATKFEGNKVYLNLYLQERPRVSRIQFEGVKRGDADKLQDKIKAIKGKIISDPLIKNALITVEKYYKDKGFYAVKVDAVQQKDTLLSNSVILKLKVNRGKKVKADEIIFEGNEAVSDKRLHRRMKIKEKRFPRIFTSSKFVPKKYEEDKKRIIKLYGKEGYRDAQILQDCVYFVKPNRVNIYMKIHEGPQYHYRNITWKGNFVYSDEYLSQVLGIKKGDIYDREELDKRLNFSLTEQDISSLYMDNGYLFFRITPVEIKAEGDSIDIEMRIYEGPQATINSIFISGNTRTSDHVILREIRTIPGRKFSRRDIIRTNQALSQLGYFDPEKIQIEPIPHLETGTVDIKYTVEEKPSDQLELSGGWGGGIGFVGTVGVIFNNFSLRKAGKLSNWHPVPAGDGQQLALRIQANGRAFQTYSLTFTEPWLGGKKPNAFSVNFSHSVQRSVINNRVLGGLQVTSATVSLGRRLNFPDDYFVLSNALSFRQYTIDNYNTGLGYNNGVSRSITLSTTLARNSIDNPTFPRTGSNISLNVTMTPPFSLFDDIEGRKNYEALSPQERFKWIEYHKWMIDASFFTPIAGKLVLNTRAHFGFLQTYSKDNGVGPFERFILGGSGLSGFNFLLGSDIIGLRGYKDNSIIPFSTGVNAGTGGTVFSKYVMELRYPLSLNPAATIYVLSFVEAGNNWADFGRFNPFNMYRSAGFGARVLMPAFGMIGIDYAVGFDDVPGNPGANGGQFHFTIGQQIR